MGTPRRDPYPWKIVQTPKLFLILFEGNVHSYRQVFLDGRPHDPNVVETWWGDSIGTWDGDTLVIDTVGMNDKAWLDLLGHPRTQQAHIIERYTRPELGRINMEITIDDPGAYSRPWKVTNRRSLLRAGKSWSTSAMKTIATCRTSWASRRRGRPSPTQRPRDILGRVAGLLFANPVDIWRSHNETHESDRSQHYWPLRPAHLRKTKPPLTRP